MLWFTSDTHFGDERLMDYNIRNFNNVDEMNETIIKKWNTVVSPEDAVYHLGDFTLKIEQDYIKNLVSQLNGNIFLVKGNHDIGSLKFYYDCGFAGVYDHPIIIKDYLVLSHEPLPFVMNKMYLSLYGHVHTSPMYQTWGEQSACMCVERHDYCQFLLEKFLISIIDFYYIL